MNASTEMTKRNAASWLDKACELERGIGTKDGEPNPMLAGAALKRAIMEDETEHAANPATASLPRRAA